MKDERPFQRLHDAIYAHRDSLTPTEKKIASHLLEHTQDIVLLSVQELAAHLNAGPASVIRVVQKLGYRGLSDLKRGLKKNIREDISPLERFRITLDRHEESGLSEIDTLAQQEVRNISATMSMIDKKTFSKAVNLVSRAHAIYTVGVGISSHVASIAALVLQHIGLKAAALHHSGLNISEQLITLRKNELLLAFSFPPYSTQTIEAAALAKKQQASVIGITNQSIAPITPHCDIVLVAKTESSIPSNSLSAVLVLLYALTSTVASKARARSTNALQKTLILRKK